MTNALPDALDAELSALLGLEGWRTDEAARRAHGEDDSRQWAMPAAVAIPRDRDQVAAIVRACRSHRVPIVARGAGTGTAAAAVPFAGGVVVSFARMDRILEIRPGDRCAVVEPGVLNGDLQQALQPKLSSITGLNTFALVPPSLPSAGGDGGGGEFLVLGIGSLEQLNELSDAIVQKAMESRRFIFLDKDLKIDKPRIEVHIDRDKAASLGIDMRTLAADMAALLSGGYTNRFAMQNRSYRVIPQVQREDRLNASALENYYTRTRSGELIPLSTVVTLKESAQPQSLKRFQQLNAVSITFAPRPGVTKGEALAILEQAAKDVLPQGYSVDYAGESRQFKQEGTTMLVTLLFALIIIFLVLSAQFESFRDAIIMLITVPMAICGALLVMNVLAMVPGITQMINGIFGAQLAAPELAGMSINIYTQVGLVTLIGVISKHGILIVEFANKLQIEQGLSKREAIEEATAIRLRPVLMTTAALVFAMIPLLLASGPGAAARFSMGTVIASGMTIGTLFTLFVLPAFYIYLARDHARDSKAAEHAASSDADDAQPQLG